MRDSIFDTHARGVGLVNLAEVPIAPLPARRGSEPQLRTISRLTYHCTPSTRLALSATCLARVSQGSGAPSSVACNEPLEQYRRLLRTL